MRPERKIKAYLSEGRLALVDPDLSHLPFIRQINPDFQICSAPPPKDLGTNLARIRGITTGLSQRDLSEADDVQLWQLHAACLAGSGTAPQDASTTLLDLKVELARRAFRDCRLCGHLCGVDRFVKPGRCGLTDKAYVAETLVHISEEAVITPAATIKLFGCALNCAGCQAFEIIHAKEQVMRTKGRLLDPGIWDSCADFERATTLEFVGGNPDESLFPILMSLRGLPTAWHKPIVWNCHGYATETVYSLLDGIVDVYMPDFKGCDACVDRISNVPRYWQLATQGIERMTRQNARIIVRILVLPGHVSCCHRPSLEWLSTYRDRLWLSFLTFIPDYRAVKDPTLDRRTSAAELSELKVFAQSLGLRDVDTAPEMFWKG